MTPRANGNVRARLAQVTGGYACADIVRPVARMKTLEANRSPSGRTIRRPVGVLTYNPFGGNDRVRKDSDPEAVVERYE
jgi:hypothetical protein